MANETTKPRLRDRGLLAGAVAETLGVGIQTLHFYERQGLIPAPPRSESGYRLYEPETVERVRFIRKAQAIGFSLEEIKEILGFASQGASPCGTVEAALAAKVRDVDARLAQLRSFRDELARLVASAGELSAAGSDARVCSIVESAPELPGREVVRTRFAGGAA